MKKVGVYFGILLLPCIGLLHAQQGPSVSVGDNRMVKPGKKTEVLNCIGSEGEIAYYIRNSNPERPSLLTFYHTIPTFNDRRKEAFENIVGEGEHAGLTEQVIVIDPRSDCTLQSNINQQLSACPLQVFTFEGWISELRVNWEVKYYNGTVRNLTDGFYTDRTSRSYFEGDNAMYNFEYGQGIGGQHFNITIQDIQYSDDGTYTCTLFDEGNNVIDSKSMNLTVVAPVRKLTVELHDKDGVIAAKESFTEGDSAVSLTPGMYMVHCEAKGSNPEPMISLYYNQDQLSVMQKNERITTGEGPTYTAHVRLGDVNIMSKSTEQLVMCEANIQGDFYPKKRAGIKLSVKIDKPDFQCANLTTRPGDKYRKLECQLLMKPGQQAPVCGNAFWRFGDSGKMIEVQSDEKFTDPEKQYNIMESECMANDKGLKVTLTFYTVQKIHMETTFYIVYGVGSDAEEYPVQIYLREVSGASVITPLTLFVTLMVAILGRHLAKNL